jgi:predicted nuclease of predicted toxin-antitoxin system
MKLLFDQNLSPKLAPRLKDLFPDSSHVFVLGLERSDDRSVREYAAIHEFVIVTKDADYSDLSMILGFPPNVIWIRRGNCSTDDIERLIRINFEIINETIDGPMPDTGVITIF